LKIIAFVLGPKYTGPPSITKQMVQQLVPRQSLLHVNQIKGLELGLQVISWNCIKLCLPIGIENATLFSHYCLLLCNGGSYEDMEIYVFLSNSRTYQAKLMGENGSNKGIF